MFAIDGMTGSGRKATFSRVKGLRSARWWAVVGVMHVMALNIKSSR
jgi:hypothetical protein